MVLARQIGRARKRGLVRSARRVVPVPAFAVSSNMQSKPNFGTGQNSGKHLPGMRLEADRPTREPERQSQSKPISPGGEPGNAKCETRSTKPIPGTKQGICRMPALGGGPVPVAPLGPSDLLRAWTFGSRTRLDGEQDVCVKISSQASISRSSVGATHASPAPAPAIGRLASNPGNHRGLPLQGQTAPGIPNREAGKRSRTQQNQGRDGWLTGAGGCSMMESAETMHDLAEVTGAWWCPWSSKPVLGREGPGWVRFPFASAILPRRRSSDEIRLSAIDKG